MIARVWQGWTAPEQADDYEALLRGEVFPGILAKRVPGFLRIELFRRNADPDVEFMTVMWFDGINAIRGFAGEDAEAAYVPAKARLLLARFEPRARHFEIRETQVAG